MACLADDFVRLEDYRGKLARFAVAFTQLQVGAPPAEPLRAVTH
jgi:hypothetical protein